MRRTTIISALVIAISGLVIIFTSCGKDEDDPKPAELSSITIKSAPTKTNYFVGESLDLSGLVITFNMDDGETEDISFSNFMSEGITCSIENGTVLTSDISTVIITHTSSGKSVNQSISVNEVVAIDLLIKAEPAKLDYYVGEILDLSGLVVTLHMNNGTDEDISFSNFTNKGITCSIENGSRLSGASAEVTIEQTKTGLSKIQTITFFKLTDIDNNIYPLVKIGDQIWMSENLKTTKYNDGTDIPLVDDNTIWSNLTTSGYCWYNNEKTTYGNIYGAIYNWYSVENENLCPLGYHIPSNAEWTTLIEYVGGESVASGKLKEIGFTHWNSPNTEATNEFGFTALPGGYRSYGGAFSSIGKHGIWWSSTEKDASYVWQWTMGYNYSSIDSAYTRKIYGFSVRCIKN